MAPLDDKDIRDALQGPDWEREGAAITREWRFPDFAAAMAFVNRVAEAADAAVPPSGHPRAWHNRVRLTLWTHTAGGITRADLDLARGIDAL